MGAGEEADSLGLFCLCLLVVVVEGILVVDNLGSLVCVWLGIEMGWR